MSEQNTLSEHAWRALPVAAFVSAAMTVLLTVTSVPMSLEVGARTFMFWTTVFVPVVILATMLSPNRPQAQPAPVSATSNGQHPLEHR